MLAFVEMISRGSSVGPIGPEPAPRAHLWATGAPCGCAVHNEEGTVRVFIVLMFSVAA